MSSISSIPDDIAVWGDELLEKGDPLGQIIALARSPDDRLVTAQREYERAHFTEPALITRWKYGVIDEIHLKAERGRKTAFQIVTTPATRFLRRLDFEIQSPIPAENPIPIFVEHGLPLSLRSLKLWIRAGKSDLSRLYPIIPNLEELDLWQPEELGFPELPRLRTLHVVGFGKVGLVILASASLPSLETLAISAVFWEELVELAMPKCPHLRTLAVRRPPWEPWFSQSQGDDEAYCARETSALLESPLVAQVKALEFHGLLERPMLAAIAAASAFDRLDRIRFVRPKDLDLQNLLTTRFGARLEWLR